MPLELLFRGVQQPEMGFDVVPIDVAKVRTAFLLSGAMRSKIQEALVPIFVDHPFVKIVEICDPCPACV